MTIAEPDAWRERMLPAERREAAAFDLVRFQIDELNSLCDRLRYVADYDSVDEKRAEIRRRCDEIAETLRWNADEVVQFTWRWLETPTRYPEDAFGPYFLLTRLAPDEPRSRAWIAALSGEVRDILSTLEWRPMAT
jgi:hypothetical protein